MVLAGISHSNVYRGQTITNLLVSWNLLVGEVENSGLPTHQLASLWQIILFSLCRCCFVTMYEVIERNKEGQVVFRN